MIAFGFAVVSVLAGSLFLRDEAFAHGVEADSRAVAVSAAANSPANTELGLTVGLTLNGDGSTCGSATSLVAQLGDTIDFCYTVTNHSATTLAYSTLEDSVDGVVFESQPTPIPIGGTYVYHRRIVATQSQTYTATWRAQDRLEGYQFDDQATTPFVDIRGTGEPVPMELERNFASIELPFPFTFYEVTAQRLCISSHGALFLDAEECQILSAYSLPFDFLAFSGIAGPAILPQWMSLQAGERGVYWEVRGEVGQRELIVQWNLPFLGITPEPTPLASNFEAILRENGTVSFVYDSLSYGADAALDNAAIATIGVQSAAGANQIANQYSYRTPLPRLPPMAIDLTLVTTPIQLTAQASVSAAIVTARMNVTPKTIARSVPSGSSTAVAADVTIANQGDGDLHWFVGEAPNARAHFPRSARDDLTPIRADQAGRSSKAADREAPPTLRTIAASATALPPLRAYAFRGFPQRTDYVWLNLNEPATVHAIADFAAVDEHARGGAFADHDIGKEYFLVGDELKIISTATGETFSLGTISGNDGATFQDLTQDPTDGTLYASAYAGQPNFYQLYKLDPNTLVSTLVGPFQPPPDAAFSRVIPAIAFSPEGLMYGIDSNNLTVPRLVAIDKTTAEYTGIGPLGTGFTHEYSMDFDPRTGVLHMLRGERLIPLFFSETDIGTIDRTSGAYTIAGQASGIVLAALAIDSTGCAQPGEVPWLSMTPASGSVAVGDAPATMGLTFDPAGLADGLYRASVCLNSNDPRQRTVAIDIEFTVGNIAVEASVSPPMLSVDVPANQSTTRSLTIGNGGGVGSLLDYEVMEASGSCGSPSSVSWLAAAPMSRNDIAPEAPVTAEVTFNSAGLAVGAYTARLCVSTNDPTNSTIEIPVVMNVVRGDRIFQSGFDSIASLSQTGDATPMQDNSIFCGPVGVPVSNEAHYWRRYVLGEYGLPASIEIESVDVSIERTIGAPELTVTLYTTPNTVAADTIEPLQLVRIGQATAAAPRDASLTSMNIPVAGTVAVTAESDLVVEVSNVDETGNGQLFVIGSTAEPETHPSFLSAHDCGVTVPTSLSALGYPSMHVIEAVHLR